MQSTPSLLSTFPAVNRLGTSQAYKWCFKTAVGVSAMKVSDHFSIHLYFWPPPIMSGKDLHSVTGHNMK